MTDQQRQLFETEPAPWELDDRAEQLVATVVFAGGPGGRFDYTVPAHLADDVEPGRRVRVPLGRGNRMVVGYCVAVETKLVAGRPLKPLAAIVDQRRLLSPSMLRLTEWIADHYLCDLGQVFETVVPAGVRAQAGTRLETVLFVEPDTAARLDALELTKKQADVIRELVTAGRPMTAVELGRAANCTRAPIDALRRKGLIRAKTERAQVERPVQPELPRQADFTLNPDQQAALDAILDAMNNRRHRTVLVHGVTGSGKTEVYIQAIQEAVRFGRQAIVLVPEISLTPQTVERFRRRFSHVAVLHSHLSDAERHRQWQEIADGRVQVVVGARSAVFAPTPNLGLVVLDEEHETTFKQETAPRYHARDVAVVRCQAEEVPLVLGSATPALESWHRAQSGQYQLVEMPRRVFGRPLPAVGTLDLCDDAETRFSRGAVSRKLHAAMSEALAHGGQVILLLNRRGYSTHIQCPACGMVLSCPHCEIALTHHRGEEIALCHYCDYQVPTPGECPDCHFRGIRFGGRGTQRLEAEVHARFPKARVARMDTDAMRGRMAYERTLDAFRAGEVQILVGTQMIAKGLDFPNVTLVGVVNADTALHLPDFRAAERTFQLVTQVAGRTGRGDKGGRVLVQTCNPDHPAILAAVRHDYAAFAAGELPARKMLGYPPFTSMIRLVIRGPKQEVTGEFAAHIGQRLAECLGEAAVAARVLGPAPAPFSKLRGKYRFQLQVQGPDAPALRAAVQKATADLKPPEEVQWIVDVDPVDMM